MPQKPLLHVWPVPHIVPLFAFIVPSAHTATPLPQRVDPTLQTFGLPIHIAPSVHAMHAPPGSHTWFVPQLEPGVLFAGESTHTETPVAHEVTPCLHGFGLPIHGWLAAHATHWPPELQTRSTPQSAPTGLG